VLRQAGLTADAMVLATTRALSRMRRGLADVIIDPARARDVFGVVEQRMREVARAAVDDARAAPRRAAAAGQRAFSSARRNLLADIYHDVLSLSGVTITADSVRGLTRMIDERPRSLSRDDMADFLGELRARPAAAGGVLALLGALDTEVLDALDAP
jgi:hypothetical protein